MPTTPERTSRPRILVTGGAGYVGSALVPALLDAGYRVRVVDIMLYGDRALDPYRANIEVVNGDIRRPPRGLLYEVDTIVNLGGLSTEPVAEYRPEANREINHQAAVHLAQLAKEAGVSRFIQASSGSIYDVGAGHAERDVLQDETTPVDPFRAYSMAKREAEKGILGLSDHRFFPVVLRKGSIYGYSRRTRMDLVVHTFVHQGMTTGVMILHNGGEMWRPLLSIRDAVAAYLLAISAPACKVAGEVFNVLNDNYRISELAMRVRHALSQIGIACDLRPDYQHRNLRTCRMSGRKFTDRVGFVPQYTVEAAAIELASKIKSGEFPDPDNPIYHNIRWLESLENENAFRPGLYCT